jgi:hypothetical protein
MKKTLSITFDFDCKKNIDATELIKRELINNFPGVIGGGLIVINSFEFDNYKKIPKKIRDEMDSDMEESGMAQGEIKGCLNRWNNKYIIKRK